MLKDILNDIVRHTSGVGMDVVRLTGEDGSIKIETIDNDRNVIVQGEISKSIENLEGTVGLHKLNVLDRYLNYEGFKEDSISIKTQEKDGQDIPAELAFKGGSTKSAYRFMAESVVNDVLKVPPFKGVKWDVEVKPSIKSFKDLQYFAGALGKTEPLFSVSTENNELIFTLGSISSDRASVTISNAVVGELQHAWKYPVSHVLAVLKMMEDGNDCTLKIADAGALLLELNSGMGTYKYIFPARR